MPTQEIRTTEPTAATSFPIRAGDFVLIDMWAKLDQPGSVYYDITWTGYCGETPERVRHVFEIVRDARDKAIETVVAARSQQVAKVAGLRWTTPRAGISRRRDSATNSCTAPDIRSAKRFTERAPIWIISKRMTSGELCRALYFR